MKKIYEEIGIVGCINQQNVKNDTVRSNWIMMTYFDRLMFILNIGTVDTTVNAKLRQASNSLGTGATDIPGYSMTQLGATDDNKHVIIEIDAATVLATDPTKPYVALVVSVGNGAEGANVYAVGLGKDYDYSYPEDFDLDNVVQIVG